MTEHAASKNKGASPRFQNRGHPEAWNVLLVTSNFKNNKWQFDDVSLLENSDCSLRLVQIKRPLGADVHRALIKQQ